MTLDKDYITSKISLFFEGATAEVNKNDNIIVTNKCKCMTITIGDFSDDDSGTLSVFLDRLDKCGLTGTNLLNSLDRFIKEVIKDGKYDIKYTMLSDSSKITWKSEMYSIDIPLGILKILTKGESWYNSFGYHQKYYHEEKEQWENIRQTSFKDILQMINNKLTKREILFDKHNDILQKYASYIGTEYTKDNINMIVSEGIKLVSKIYKPNTNNMTMKNLAVFLDSKHNMIYNFSDDENFADALIIYFAEVIINYDHVLYKLYDIDYDLFAHQ